MSRCLTHLQLARKVTKLQATLSNWLTGDDSHEYRAAQAVLPVMGSLGLAGDVYPRRKRPAKKRKRPSPHKGTQ